MPNAKSRAKAAKAAASASAAASGSAEEPPPEQQDSPAGIGAELCKNLQEVMRMHVDQVKQLRTMAAAKIGSKQKLIEEEQRRLKISMQVLVQVIQALREGGPVLVSILLLAVQLELLEYLGTIDILRLAACSKTNRAGTSSCAWSGVGRADKLGGCAAAAMAMESFSKLFKKVVPHLDAAPAVAGDAKKFFNTIDLQHVQSVHLPREQLDILLSPSTAPELEMLERLTLPVGFEHFAVLHKFYLRYLTVEVSSADRPITLKVCEGLARTLRLFSKDPLDELTLRYIPPDFARLLLHAATLADRGATRRLVLTDSDLPDEAAAKICEALTSDRNTGSHMTSVHFLDCTLSELAEERVIQALEEQEGLWMATIEGGVTKTSDMADLAKWLEFGPQRQAAHDAVDELEHELSRLRAEEESTQSRDEPSLPDLMKLAFVRMQETFEVNHPAADSDNSGNVPPAQTEGRAAAAEAGQGDDNANSNNNTNNNNTNNEEEEPLELQKPMTPNSCGKVALQDGETHQKTKKTQTKTETTKSERGEVPTASAAAATVAADEENEQEQQEQHEPQKATTVLPASAAASIARGNAA